MLFIAFGIIAGIYPAYRILKKEDGSKSDFNLFGKSLVTFQNGIAITMIASVILIWDQVRFMKNHDLGFDKDQLIAVHLFVRLTAPK